ncbi:MAG: redoxin domain-containing protein, partial [Acidobacteriota bacterium]
AGTEPCPGPPQPGLDLSWRPEVSQLQPGQPAPPFEVQDHTGRTVRLSDFNGKTVVVWFYPKADTPG